MVCGIRSDTFVGRLHLPRMSWWWRPGLRKELLKKWNIYYIRSIATFGLLLLSFRVRPPGRALYVNFLFRNVSAYKRYNQARVLQDLLGFFCYRRAYLIFFTPCTLPYLEKTDYRQDHTEYTSKHVHIQSLVFVNMVYLQTKTHKLKWNENKNDCVTQEDFLVSIIIEHPRLRSLQSDSRRLLRKLLGHSDIFDIIN